MLGGSVHLNPRFVGCFVSHTPHRGLSPQALDAFGFNFSSQLGIGYHCLAFLNQVRKKSQKLKIK